MATARTDRMLVESAMPTFDSAIAEHVVVAADPTTTFDAASAMDLVTVRTPRVTASMWIRSLPLRIFGKASPPLHRLVTGQGLGLPGWSLLGEQVDREIAFGAVGRFWQPVIVWRHVAPTEFASFAEPGWGKIAANFSVTPYGECSTLVSYECRTVATDPESRRRFLRHWWLIRPFVGHIMRATLNKIKAAAEAAAEQGSMMRVLVAFGSKRGGTAGLAGMIGDALTEAGCEAIVSPAGNVYDLTGVDAVIVAGALYANRWHRDARRFVKRNTAALRTLPVWLVSSGPLDDSARQRDIAPTSQVRRLAAAVGARGHITFGGRLAPDAKGFPASAMAKDNAGDWRDQAHVQCWVHTVVNQLHKSEIGPGHS